MVIHINGGFKSDLSRTGDSQQLDRKASVKCYVGWISFILGKNWGANSSWFETVIEIQKALYFYK